MAILVTAGTMCKCTFGTTPCPIIVNSQQSGIASNSIVATIFDNTPTNISTFGMCTSMTNPTVSAATAAALGVLTPQPCKPMVTTQWTMGSSTILFQNKPALLQNSQLLCMWGGIIQIVQPLQQTVQAAQ
ncbi:DUF4280 domain-containing protein [Clostridium sp. MD294]|uniref:DUF4280 domain-containing protein n=1 Tax=Clostridium sp. MD294 TaxID=97138 RepID=UPI0002CC158F|nr:DUF4280 domain-containing protein [Clostridium sp. MD294]NDO46130.1 DUF4280 domain-containing protein [Clostridium sp. MD294]USF30204.1 hypothetical protein C820_001645 [Clostridium sp. MD294]